jgi:hypothetical protein
MSTETKQRIELEQSRRYVTVKLLVLTARWGHCRSLMYNLRVVPALQPNPTRHVECFLW